MVFMEKASKSGPVWIKIKKEDAIKIVADLSKKGKTAAEIGIILRDQYGIPSFKVLTEKRIMDIKRESGLAKKLPEDLTDLIKRAVIVQKHLKLHKKDKHSRRGLQLIESKIKSLSKYYKRKGILPEDWLYSSEKAELLIE